MEEEELIKRREKGIDKGREEEELIKEWRKRN